VSERGPRASSNPALGKYKEVWVLVLGFFMFLSAVFSGLSVVLYSRGRVEGKVGSTCEEFKNNVY